ncbi:MAG: aldehyde dehydrogenase family protein [Melioribacteraceae bacterium]|nr:aldehyde dehydrogenase family protein [Melioribacteraceae bacterium]
MSNAYFKVPEPINEPVKTYVKGSPERNDLTKRMEELKSQEVEVPLIIGGEEVKTGNTQEMVIPHNKKHVLGVYHKAGTKEVNMAIEAALEARKEWANMPWEHRVTIF